MRLLTFFFDLFAIFIGGVVFIAGAGALTIWITQSDTAGVWAIGIAAVVWLYTLFRYIVAWVDEVSPEEEAGIALILLAFVAGAIIGNVDCDAEKET